MESQEVDVVVVGAGISGLAAVKCLLDAGVEDVVVLERTDQVGGLWTYREAEAYGVMAFTHINVSKPNYSFSDFPFPSGGPDFAHHSEMATYIRAYADRFGLLSRVRFGEEVTSLRLAGSLVEVETPRRRYLARHVAVASGHHVAPQRPDFPGLERFEGRVLHSAEYKSAERSAVAGDALVVGIGNSAVDVAADLARARKGRVFLSTRSGAWVFPNYVLGFPTDLYACRAFLRLPWRVATAVMELLLALLAGHPRRWGLNPRMRALQTQPTVSATLVHHIQRGEVEVVADVARFQPRDVLLTDGRSLEVAQAVLCTGFRIGFPFLEPAVAARVLDPRTHEMRLFKNVFAPGLGDRLAFIGFVQPASGGLLPVSEMQARWFAELVCGRLALPERAEMERCVAAENEATRRRYFASPRHTIQREPLLYCDDVAARIGARPSLWRWPGLAWRLLFGSCGTAQWRLQGPNAWAGAEAEVRRVPVTPMMNVLGAVLLLLLLLVACGLGVVVRPFLSPW